MGFIDIEKILYVEPDQISDDEKENLYVDLTTLEVPFEIDVKNFYKLFQIIREILKFKGEQVESLILELDGLAIKLGEEEAKRKQNYIDKTNNFEIALQKNEHDDKSTDSDDYSRKLVKMEIQRDRLINELQEKEEELINEKRELEKLASKVSSLEEENKVFKKELQVMQQELSTNSSSKITGEDQDYSSMERYRELGELLRQKNKHITQLLNDIEEIEKENIIFKEKLSIVRDELSEGAEQMSKLSMERITLRTYVDELNGKLLKLEKENVGLRNQISELVAAKEKREKLFENMSANFESKIQYWKDISDVKESELMFLKHQLVSGTSNRKMDETDHLAVLSNLNKTVVEREEKILELQQQLQQAITDLNENTRLLEEQKVLFKSKFDKNSESNTIKQLIKKLEQAESRIAVLEAKTKFAEEESLRKAEEVTELIIQLREYESGTYGLEEAAMRIKDLQKQKQIRDTQIEQLVQNSNRLQDEVNFLEQENQILREKLGISLGEQIVIDDFSHRNLNRQNKIFELTTELETCQDELLSIKLENRKLNKEIISLHSELNFYRLKESAVNVDDSQISLNQDNNADKINTIETENNGDTLKEVIDENESLRRGMHEILDCIRNRDSSSFVKVESETLERLLEALDSRHVSGWYQPAMRLQAHIHHLYGVNKTLREELHSYRNREDELLHELHEAALKIERLQDTSLYYKPVPIISSPEVKPSSPKLKKAISCSEETLRIDDIEKELVKEKEKCKKLELEFEKLCEKNSLCEDRINKIQEEYELDKQNWDDVKTTMQKRIDDTQNNELILQLKVNEYERSLDVLKQNPDDIKKAFIECTVSVSSLKVELQQLSRKYQGLLEMESHIRQERNKLFNEIYSLKLAKDQEISELKQNNEQLTIQLKNQMTLSDEYVSRQEHDKVSNDFYELTIKYREIQQIQILIHSGKETLISKLQNEVASLLSQKMELEISLRGVREEIKNIKYLSSNNSVVEEVATLTKQIASLETEIINKKQYSDHTSRMYELTKEQLNETENRCKHLEEQLLLIIQNNSELQKNEASLKEKMVQLPSVFQSDDLVNKLKNAEMNIAALNSQKTELEEIANIAHDQVKALEQYNKYQDFEYDSLQRRILELQSLSDEKVIIDRLTKELLLLQQNGIHANTELNNFKDKLTKTESEMLEAKMKLSEQVNKYNNLQKESSHKMKIMYAIIYELQKRFLGSFPLVKEELCAEKLMKCKEECYVLSSLVLNMKLPSALNDENSNDDQNEDFSTYRISKEGKNKPTFNVQDFSMRLINEGLQNKLHLYAERLERQDRLISRLEEEIIHADEQCQEFLIYWNPQTNLKFPNQNEDNLRNKCTQTTEKETKQKEHTDKVTSDSEQDDELNQANNPVKNLHHTLKLLEDELQNTRDELNVIMVELKEKNMIITNKEKEILNLRKIGFDSQIYIEESENNGEENSVKKLAFKATIDSLQHIINQKEEIITRLQNLLKKNGEEHAQNILQLVREMKILKDSVDSKEQICNRLNARLEIIDKPSSEKYSIIDSYLTKIHELEDELNQSNQKVQQLSVQLTTSNQQAELWSRTAEERLKTLQNMTHELNVKRGINVTSNVNENNKISHTSLLQTIKEKTEEIQRLNQTIEELKKRLGSGEKLPGYRDRLKNELERHKRKVELLEQKEREDKAEIQKLKNQILTRPQSARKKETLVTPKEEQLYKKIRNLETQIEEYKEKEKKWKENRRTKIDGEIEKWQNKKRHQQNYEKLHQQLKDQSIHSETLKLNNERLKETIVRLEKERYTLESKLKAVKSQTAGISLIEELQKTNDRLEEEIKVLRMSAQLPAGTTALTNVIEAQERKIKAFEIAQKGDSALAEEVEKLNERKSQLQKYNVHLEEENMRLKLEIRKLKSSDKNSDELSDIVSKTEKFNRKANIVDLESESKGNKRKNSDLEKAVLVLRRVVEKLQAENKRLYSNKVSQLHDKNYVENLQMELQNLQGNYLDAIEKASVLDKEVQNAYEKITSLQKLIERLQNGEEIKIMKDQLLKKNLLLSKVKNLLEKAARREKELVEKLQNLQQTNSVNVSVSCG